MKKSIIILQFLSIVSTMFGYDFNPDTNDVFLGLQGPVKSCTYKSVRSLEKPDEFHFESRLGGNKVLYDRDGRIIQRIFFREKGKTSNHYYTYDEKGNLLKIERHSFNGNYTEILYYYDNQDRLFEVHYNYFDKFINRYIYDGSKIRIDWLVENENDDNKITKLKKFKKINLGNNEKIIEIITYKSDNSIVDSKSYKYYDSETVKEIVYSWPKRNFVKITRFNKNGEVIEIINKRDNKLRSHIIYKYPEYDSYGNWTRREKYKIKDGKEVLIDIEIREFEYYQEL